MATNLVKVNKMTFTVENNSSIKKAAVALSLVGSSHAFSQTPLFAAGFSPASLQIIDVGDDDRSDNPAMQDKLDEFVDNGFADHGKHFMPLWIGAGNARNGEFVCADDAEWTAIYAFASCGLDLSKLPAGKSAKYLALMMSSVKSWNQVFPEGGNSGLFKYPEIENWGIFNDIEVPAVGVFDKVTPHGSKRETVSAADGETNKITDGAGLYVIDDTRLSNAARVDLIRNAEAFTIRAPGIKGCLAPVLKTALLAYIANNNVDPIRPDYWGNPVNLLELQVITYASVFKWAKCVSSWQEYVKAFHAYNHKVWICVQAHGRKWANLPYQQLQTLDATKEEIALLATRSANAALLDYAEVGKCGKIIGGNIGKAVDMLPEMMQDPWVRKQLQMGWISKAKKMFGGRVMKIIHNLFSMSDVVAQLDGIFGLPVNGVIAGKNCFTRAFKYGKRLGATRNPHLDNAWAILENKVQETPKEYRGFFCGTTMFFSAHDNTMKLHQMDFDGDHSAVTDDELLISIAERTRRLRKEETLLYAAMDAGGQKACLDYKDGLNHLCKASKKAPIGFYVNTLTKMYAIGNFCPGNVQKMHCLTRKANTCIDEGGGHGADAAVGLADDTAKQMSTTKKPLFLAYAKGHVSADGLSIIPADAWEKFQLYPKSVVDQYSAVCRLIIPQKAEDVIDLNGLGVLDTRVMRHKPQISDRADKMRDLIRVNGGYFNDLVRKTAAEEQLISESSSLKACPDFTLDKISYIQLALAEYAEDRGLTLDDVTDYLVYFLFYKTKRRYNAEPVFISMMKRWLFLALGDRVLANIEANKGVAFADTEDYDTDEDDDE